MKLKTSFSKLTPLKKDITRFAPVWALYLVGLIMVLVNSLRYMDPDHAARQLPAIIISFGIVNLFYAMVCAQLLFGDLFNTKMCYSLHALPQRRESWLLSHFCAGLLFSLVPNLVACLAMMPSLGDMGGLVFYVLLAMELQFLFFFGLATVSVMVTGNRFAGLLVYGGLNFVAPLAWWILDTIYLPLLEGVTLDFFPFSQVCPAVKLFDFEFMTFEQVTFYDKQEYIEKYVYEFRGLADGWGYLAVLGILGLALMGLATLLYRWRHLESAGDFVAFSRLKAPMAVAITLCAGGAAAFIGQYIFGDSLWPWLIVGILVGWFGGMMLLERRIKVFRLKNIIGFAVLAAVLVVSYLLTAFDAFGLVRWVPTAGQVESVTIANYNADNYNHYDRPYSNRVSVTLEDQEEIADIIDAHQDIIDRLENPKNSTHRVVITYRLESGRTVKRSYWAPASGKNYEIISKYFYTARQILGYDDWDKFLANMEMLHVNGNEISPEYMEAVMEAFRADCAVGQIRTFDTGDSIGYAYYRSGEVYRELAILAGAEKTMAVLSQPEIVLGYEDWETFLKSVKDLCVDGVDVKQTHLAGLLEAVRSDCEKGNMDLLNEKEGLYWLEYQTASNDHYLAVPSGAAETVAYIEQYILN